MNCTICGLPGLDLDRLARKLRDGAKLMVGQGDYDAYVAHCARATTTRRS